MEKKAKEKEKETIRSAILLRLPKELQYRLDEICNRELWKRGPQIVKLIQAFVENYNYREELELLKKGKR